ncbi:FAD-dependent oxidoreductase [Rhodococcus sp. BP-252]|uniref:oxidoreductase n=1 Tax=unclassified Rhodococcus (in: high G+C Gram-positive bacteria) TaxID=192944 RepID=UPI00142FC73D|nr:MULTISPECIES: FAD-dependent oxidoreductase [unclassified Rhodococcus (in: high G+C Gram-positive bacteria)]NIL77392.1 NADH oxidase [Rhodococcus sp. B10]MBY6412169.1 FAD-dependent oxidoreductase [Rhodococcus sp. BP-320]MBY6416749.1 FAD-dependent oxidoreductase [Rhodococcus sp. BP-321]MBY6421062.1 FAD-dependent oxidoreductase [Rhodococcus sp. BP-324]MBY6426773.1 FAD-dependent oxidoreductase [Rhodococcus sp. BP-323]
MSAPFPHLFSPIQLGGITLKNRLVALPAGTSMAVDGVPTHGDTEHFERLAAGGVGMIIGGATVVHPTTTLRSRKLIEAYRDEFVPAAAAKVEAVHRHGAKFVGQLCHIGREFIGGESDAPPSAPSAIKTVRDAYPPHELSAAEIDDIVEGWRVSTRNLVAAGADGVELHAAHGYLPAQFMSPLTNRRSDSFGGSFEARMRFPRMIIDAMRSEIPAGFVLGVRLSGEEEIPGGMGIDDCVRIAENLAELGIDYFSITHGTRGKYVKDSSGEDAVAIPSAARVKAATGLPTLVGQRIRDAGTADHAIKSGHADMVGMARALIADPELPNKSRTGRVAEIRGCLGVNQDCRAFDPHLHCAVNAEIGRGRHVDVGKRARKSKEVFVIGGGPAGLEAARVAAGRGHRVTVFEQDKVLGGSVRVAASAPRRATLIDIVDYLERELRRLKVDVNLSAGIGSGDLDDIRSAADHVVVAIGSRPAKLTPVLQQRTAFTVDDVLLGRVPAAPGRVVVFDDGDGFWPAYSAAEALAQRGWDVTFATALTALASRVPPESAGPLLARLGSAGVDFKIAHALDVPDDLTAPVTLRPVFGTGDLTYEDIAVVWHGPRVAVPPWGFERSDTVSIIGDCVTPRRISHAIAEGYRAGAEL